MASASKLLQNGTVLSFDEDTQSIKVLRNTSLLLLNGRIEAISEDVPKLSIPENCEVIDVTGKILSPGFVNTHLHAWMTAFRTISPDITLTHYFGWLGPSSETAQKAFTPDGIYWSALEGFLEGLNGGVTTFLDHAHAAWSPEVLEKGYEAALDSGARIWWCYEPSSSIPGFEMEKQWAALTKIASVDTRNDLVPLGLSYQGLAGAKGEEFTTVKKMISDLKLEAITIHHLGGPWPTMNSSPHSLVDQDLHTLGVPIILSHASYLTNDEQKDLRDQNFHISITPESEFHYGHGQTTGHLVSDQASIGVDTAFTFSGDILTQARIWLQKARDVGFQEHLTKTGLLPRNTPLTAEQGFLLATRQGGKALWRDDIGVLKPGAKADIVVFNGDSPNMLGWTDPVAAVMLHANVGDIEHVLVNGEFRKKDFKLVDGKHKWAEVKQKFLETAERAQAVARETMTAVPEKLWGHFPTGDVATYSTFKAT
ncbi:putative metal-dependent hydrolase, composite domain superfamily [Septoria linicola]|nr:putative metal-dependent hydrolase, composite domain superfamily [Septoria linicola]